MRWLRSLRMPTAPAGSEGGMERWLITYADMITLLLVMFIVLYSTANTDLEKFRALAESLAEGFGATSAAGARRGATIAGTQSGTNPIWDTSGGGISPVQLFPEHQTPIEIFQFARMLAGAGEEQGQLMAEMQGLVQEALAAAGAEGLDVEGLGAEVQVEFNERGIRITIFPDQILFVSGSARLRPHFRQILDALYEPLSRLSNRIEIQGHTDSVPINTATYPSNWELSAGRAGSVIRYLEAKGLPPERLQAAGYADTMPVDTNETRQGRARNRRVEILVLREESESAQRWLEERQAIEAGGATLPAADEVSVEEPTPAPEAAEDSAAPAAGAPDQVPGSGALGPAPEDAGTVTEPGEAEDLSSPPAG